MELIIFAIILFFLYRNFGVNSAYKRIKSKQEDSIKPYEPSNSTTSTSNSQSTKPKSIPTKKEINDILNTNKPSDQKRADFYNAFHLHPGTHSVVDEILGLNKVLSTHKPKLEAETPNFNLFKPEWREIEQILQQYNITALYHFTDKKNISSIIEKKGLYSWEWFENNGFQIPVQGGNNLSKRLDQDRNLQNFVRVSFAKNTPMLYVSKQSGRIRDEIILEVSPEVIFLQPTLFSNLNATDRYAHIGNTLNDFQKIKFDVISKGGWSTEEEKKFYQAEVLVKEHIPLKYIKGI